MPLICGARYCLTCSPDDSGCEARWKLHPIGIGGQKGTVGPRARDGSEYRCPQVRGQPRECDCCTANEKAASLHNDPPIIAWKRSSKTGKYDCIPAESTDFEVLCLVRTRRATERDFSRSLSANQARVLIMSAHFSAIISTGA